MLTHLAMPASLLLALAAAFPAHADEIKVISAEAVRGALEGVATQFTKETGHKVSFAFMTAGQVRDRVESGEPIDIAIASSTVISKLAAAGQVAGATNLGRIGLAVAVRDGAPTPDVSTSEAFTKTLLAAKSVSFTDPAAGGTAGLYFLSLLKKLGIADEIAKKTVHSKGGRDAASKVANGEAELGITFPSEIMPVKGARVGGMLPVALQNYTTYVGALPAARAENAAARAYLAALTAAAAREQWVAAGFEPPSAQ
jgi:molybdate transport system substrate-binding protein